MSGLASKFVTEEEVQDQRQKRQSEWEKVRQADDPAEAPEAETRSLFEQLSANKTVQDQEADDESKLRASVKGLDEEEVHFLNFVSNRQLQIEKDRSNEEQSVIAELKNKAEKVITVEDKQKAASSSSSSASAASSAKKSQLQLLKGAIKRKSTDSKPEVEEKKSKSDCDESPDARLMAGLPPSQVMQCAGVLPGLGDYLEGDSSTENSSNSDDSEADHQVIPSNSVQLVLAEYKRKMKEAQ